MIQLEARVVIGTADGAVRFYDYQFRVSGLRVTPPLTPRKDPTSRSTQGAWTQRRTMEHGGVHHRSLLSDACCATCWSWQQHDRCWRRSWLLLAHLQGLGLGMDPNHGSRCIRQAVSVLDANTAARRSCFQHVWNGHSRLPQQLRNHSSFGAPNFYILRLRRWSHDRWRWPAPSTDATSGRPAWSSAMAPGLLLDGSPEFQIGSSGPPVWAPNSESTQTHCNTMTNQLQNKGPYFRYL